MEGGNTENSGDDKGDARATPWGGKNKDDANESAKPDTGDTAAVVAVVVVRAGDCSDPTMVGSPATGVVRVDDGENEENNDSAVKKDGQVDDDDRDGAALAIVCNEADEANNETADDPVKLPNTPS